MNAQSFNFSYFKTYLQKCVQEWQYLKDDNVPLEKVYILLQAEKQELKRVPSGELADVGDFLVKEKEKQEQDEQRFREEATKTEPPVELEEALQKAQHLVLIGEPGAGKSVTLQYMGLQFARAALKDKTPFSKLDEKRIPILLDLKDDLGPFLNETHAIEKAVEKAIKQWDGMFKPDQETLKEWIYEGHFLLLLDSLDEVSEREREKTRAAINAFRVRAEKCRLIVASRPAGYHSIDRNFHDFRLLPLDERAPDFLQKWMAAWQDKEIAEVSREAQTAWEIIQNNPSLNTLTRTPLTLKMIAEIAAQSLEKLQNIKGRANLYQRYVEGVAWERAKKRGAQEKDKDWALNILEALAWLLHVEEINRENSLRQRLGEMKWSPAGQEKPEPLLNEERNWDYVKKVVREQLGLVGIDAERETWRFSHKTWQEYFVARRLAHAWEKHPKETRVFLKPRLHLYQWREVLLLMVSLSKKEQAQNFIKEVAQAGSLYERRWRRDAQLAVILAGMVGDIAYVLDAMNSEYFQVRWAAAEALGKLAKHLNEPEMLIEPLISALKDKDDDVRWAAAEALKKLAEHFKEPEKLIEPLISALKDKDDDVRWAATEALKKLAEHFKEPEKLIEPLISALKDKDDDVRWAAAEALGKLAEHLNEPEKLIEPLTSALKDKDDVRQAAAEALGKLADRVKEPEEFIKPLLKALEDKDNDVRWAAAEALVKLAEHLNEPEKLIEHLISALKDKYSYVRWAPARALEKLAEHLKEPEKLIEHLISALQDKDSYVRRAAAEALVKLAEHLNEPEKLIEPLISALQDKDSYVRRAAARALGKLAEHFKEPEKLIEPLISDKDSYVRRAAVEALEKLAEHLKEPEKLIEPLISALKDKDSYIRRAAARALGKLAEHFKEPEKLIEHLISALQDKDSYVRWAAVEALEKLVDEKTAIKILPRLKRKLWVTWWNRKKHAAIYDALKILTPFYESFLARQKTFDPLFPPGPSAWKKALRWGLAGSGGFLLLSFVFTIKAISGPATKIFGERIEQFFRSLSTIELFLIILVSSLLTGGLSMLAKFLWEKRKIKNSSKK